MSTKNLKIGTRKSPLALWQSRCVASLLEREHPHVQCSLVHFETQGDRQLDNPLPEIGGKGLFTAELELALQDGSIDLAVHSLKDLPTKLESGVVIGAILAREDARDVLISRQGLPLDTLPAQSVIGTSSLRRQAQLLRVRHNVQIRSIRGNVETRIRKVMSGEFDATILAAAGVHRLNLRDQITEYLPFEIMLPAPGQGALAVQCREFDEQILTLLAPLHDEPTAKEVLAERTFLRTMDSGCSTPVAALGMYKPELDEITLEILVASTDGTASLRLLDHGQDPVSLGQRLAYRALNFGAQDLIQKT
jgi:hydroxymethylbilane synthase